MNVRNLQYIRSQDPKLFEALQDIIGGLHNVTQQANGNGSGQPDPPPAVNGVKVTGANGFLHVAIQDQNPIYRGIRYYAEHADNPQFTNPQVVPMLDSRNVTIPVGNQSRYVRVYSAYSSSPPSSAVYHGSAAEPVAVSAGGTAGPAPFLDSQGSGTGAAGVGLSGPGPVPFRSASGAPPVR